MLFEGKQKALSQLDAISDIDQRIKEEVKKTQEAQELKSGYSMLKEETDNLKIRISGLKAMILELDQKVNVRKKDEVSELREKIKALELQINNLKYPNLSDEKN